MTLLSYSLFHSYGHLLLTGDRACVPPNQAKNLKMCITAGVGSDHIELNAAVDHRIQVLEVCRPVTSAGHVTQLFCFRFRVPT
jgi:lactate dehydrogenase-like 2-hydroxyacid dehydrogenase